MPGFVTFKFLGFLSGGLGIALAAASIFGWLQTERLSAARETITAKVEQIEVLEQRVVNDAALIKGRDELIAMQNEAVLNMAQAAEANRKAYQARIAQADKVAVSYREQAQDILSLQLETKDELERSRAALQLIVDTFGQENN